MKDADKVYSGQSLEFLSEKKMKDLERDLDYLTRVKRKEISQALEESISLGDISENAEYQETKEVQLMNEKKIADIEDLLSRAVVVPDSNKIRTTIEIGCSVMLKRILDGFETNYHIVGSSDADPFQGKISSDSPLGMVLMGKRKGQKIKALTPKGETEYTIIKII